MPEVRGPLRTLSWTLAFGALCACRKPEASASDAAAAPVPSEPQPAPTKPKLQAVKGSADLTFSGTINREFKGAVASCDYTRFKGVDRGWNWAFFDDDFTFQIIVLTDTDFDEPSAALTSMRPMKVNYMFRSDGGTITAAADRTRAEIDADLRNPRGKEVVHVTGSLTCLQE